MAHTLTRRQIARYAAAELANGADTHLLFKKLAQWLVGMKMTRSFELLIADIKQFLADEHHVLYADIISAYPLEERVKQQVKDLLTENSQTTVILSEKEDESLLGGMIVRTTDRELDVSVRKGIKTIKALAER